MTGCLEEIRQQIGNFVRAYKNRKTGTGSTFAKFETTLNLVSAGTGI